MKGRLKIFNGEIITSRQNLGIGTVIIEDGKIIGVDKGNAEVPGCKEVDAGGNYIFPGLIDIHSHGSGNFDFMDCSQEACQGISREHARHGCTTMFPTTLASDTEELVRFLEVYDSFKGKEEGAAFGGLHLEGPYFAYAFRGAQDPKYLKNPDPEEYLPILERCPDIKRWSVAPELPGGLEMGRILSGKGIVASIAHTDAIYEDVLEAWNAGYSLITHFYSCMNGVTRRNAFRYAGCIEAGYLIEEMDLEVIGDGIHVPTPLLQLIMKNKSVDRIILCTDSMRGAGMPEGMTCILGSLANGQEVIIEDGVAKLMDRSCFAGSVCTTERLVRTAYMAGASLPDAVAMVSANPARKMGIGDRKGSIKEGYDADVVICTKDFRIEQTYVKGNRVY